MEGDVLGDECCDEEVAVVVALVAAEAQGVAHFGRRLLQRPRRQLRLEEVVREALVHENGAQLRQRAVLEGTAGLWLGERRGRGEGTSRKQRMTPEQRPQTVFCVSNV